MRPGQNKRIRGRNGRKGPNPLTRSYESNGPDVKIRGTAQHVAEKYLQLARDAQSSGDTIMAESLLQHAEHYFRLIAAAQAAQQQAQGGGYARPYEAEADLDDDDDLGGVPDRFAPLAERLPQPAYQQQPQPYSSAPYPQPAPQPQFAPQQQPQPQPFEERPIGDRPVNEPRYERQPRQDRGGFRDRRDRDRGGEQNAENGGERPYRQNFDRNRERRFPPRALPAAQDEAPTALPSFITAAPIRAADPEEAESFARSERAAIREHEEAAAGFHLNQRRRRRTRAQNDDGNGNVASGDESPRSDELPLAD